MDSMPVAFSVHNFISSVGADAGFAAIIGLAVLILLYFAHARETANLREEAAILAERLQQAEARVAELSRLQPASAPVAEGVGLAQRVGVAEGIRGVHVTDQRTAAPVLMPFAPAGVGAPALSAATRVVPLPEAPASMPAVPAPQPAMAMAGAAPGASGAASPSTVVPPPPSVSGPRPPIPTAPAAPARDRAAAAAHALPAPATSAGANGGGRGPAATAARGPAPGMAATAGASRATSSSGRSPRPLPSLTSPAPSRRGMGRRIGVGLVALLLLAAAVVALVVITNNNGSGSKAAAPPRTTNAPAPTRAAAFSPASVTVAVLNGTATNQLAHRVATKLASSGYKEGRVATAANQTQTSTIVAYLPGAKNRADALHVATALNLKPTAVQPIDQPTQQVACPPPGGCGANVVVTVGADLATL